MIAGRGPRQHAICDHNLLKSVQIRVLAFYATPCDCSARPGPPPDSMRAPAHFSHFGFLPLDQFSMIAFSNAVEVLRMANYLERAPLYRWSVLSAGGHPVAASN